MWFCWTFVVYLVYFTLYNAIVNIKKLIREPLITPIIFTAPYQYPLLMRGCKKFTDFLISDLFQALLDAIDKIDYNVYVLLKIISFYI